MNPKIYYIATLLLYISEIGLSLVIDDIGLIFGFIGTFAGSGLFYFCQVCSSLLAWTPTELKNSKNKTKSGKI